MTLTKICICVSAFNIILNSLIIGFESFWIAFKLSKYYRLADISTCGFRIDLQGLFTLCQCLSIVVKHGKNDSLPNVSISIIGIYLQRPIIFKKCLLPALQICQKNSLANGGVGADPGGVK